MRSIKSERGTIIIVVAILLPILMIVGLLPLQKGLTNLYLNQAQNASDSGSLAGSSSLARGETMDQAKAAALNICQKNQVGNAPAECVVEDKFYNGNILPPGSGEGMPDNAVQVRVNYTFPNLLNGEPISIQKESAGAAIDSGKTDPETGEKIYRSALVK